MQIKHETHKAKFNNFSANLNISENAKTLLSQIQAIKDNMQITKAEEREQIKAIFDEASDEIKQELKLQHRHFGSNGHRRFGRHRFGEKQGVGFDEEIGHGNYAASFRIHNLRF
uniref:Uncharacterized protein n=1 Tax=Panagrolaimus superbus TaxID=310955 RepID=A0A914YNN1_9BILA